MNVAEQFFYEHAGYSYNPASETPEEGKRRGAVELTAAEVWAVQHGFSFEWEQDDIDSSDFSDDEPYPLYVCLMLNDHGEPVHALGGVDFGPDKTPRVDQYRRVVQAELALDVKTGNA